MEDGECLRGYRNNVQASIDDGFLSNRELREKKRRLKTIDHEIKRRTDDHTPGENAEKMMVAASGEKSTAQPLADAIADLKYKEALDKEANTSERDRRRKNVEYVRQQPKEPTRAPRRGRGMRGMGR